MRWMRLTSATLLAALLVACGGEEPQADPGDTPAATDGAVATTSEPASTTEPDEGGSAETAPESPESPESLEELAAYEGDDWLEVMRAGAEETDNMSVYTAIPPDTIGPLLDEFTAEYGVEIDLYSATTEDIRNRVLQEQSADRFAVDLVLGGDALQHLILESEGALQAYTTPSAQEYEGEFGEPGRTWYPLYENYFVAAYNTDLLDASEVPTTYEAALDERWQGQMGIEASDVGWYATLIDVWGEEEGNAYFEALAAQQPFIVSGHTTLTNLVISGEVPYALTIYNYRAESEKASGAPIEWVPLEPAVAIYNGLAIPRQAPNPHAALALAEFLLAEPGQSQLAELTGQIPSHPNVPADPPGLKEGFEAVPTSYELLLEDFDGWQTRWEDTIISGQPTLGG